MSNAVVGVDIYLILTFKMIINFIFIQHRFVFMKLALFFKH